MTDEGLFWMYEETPHYNTPVPRRVVHEIVELGVEGVRYVAVEGELTPAEMANNQRIDASRRHQLIAGVGQRVERERIVAFAGRYALPTIWRALPNGTDFMYVAKTGSLTREELDHNQAMTAKYWQKIVDAPKSPADLDRERREQIMRELDEACGITDPELVGLQVVEPVLPPNRDVRWGTIGEPGTLLKDGRAFLGLVLLGVALVQSCPH
jgi:hypothetical protein